MPPTKNFLCALRPSKVIIKTLKICLYQFPIKCLIPIPLLLHPQTCKYPRHSVSLNSVFHWRLISGGRACWQRHSTGNLV